MKTRLPRLPALNLLMAVSMLGAALAEENRPNILFIAIDDLRPELKVYGAEHIKLSRDILSEWGSDSLDAAAE